ncbi:MAG: serine/threonine-protein phosphatase [Zoogloeaceae bacterium]|jgi:serine/threonine protein phosphatase PrpC|nr:serine/threonine-protein phosphatase [Zoogloeaceae bacterium]
MRFTIYQDSRRGGRGNNEDRLAHCYSRDALLLAVADGMGGHYYGEVASQIAVQTLVAAFQREARPMLEDPFAFLQEHIFSAHRAILDYSIRQHLRDSPRTTLTACLIQNNVAYWIHAGDSRLYLIRNGRIAARTRDHSVVQRMVDEGRISLEEAEHHPERNRIYSCLGGPQLPELEFSHKTPLQAGDVIALCTDGVWGVLPNENILAQALQDGNLLKVVPLFMDRVENIAGQFGDNLSILAVRWEENYADHVPTSSVSTQGMGMTDVTTHMEEFGNIPRPDLSDDEIELAIDEIRAAIEKYSFKK